MPAHIEILYEVPKYGYCGVKILADISLFQIYCNYTGYLRNYINNSLCFDFVIPYDGFISKNPP